MLAEVAVAHYAHAAMERDVLTLHLRDAALWADEDALNDHCVLQLRLSTAQRQNQRQNISLICHPATPRDIKPAQTIYIVLICELFAFDWNPILYPELAGWPLVSGKIEGVGTSQLLIEELKV